MANPLDIAEWSSLLKYGQEILIAPPRAGKRVSLPNIIKKRITSYINRTVMPQSVPTGKARPYRKDMDSLSSIIRSKIEDGNIKAAVRILCSDVSLAVDNEETLRSLLDKHP